MLDGSDAARIGDKHELFHATDVVNRDSILRHGLDWRQMGAARGIAGSDEPEIEGIFLFDDMFDIGWWSRMAGRPTDIWAVRVDGIHLQSLGSQEWIIVRTSIEVERLRLLSDEETAPWRDS
ncbi:MAG: hypothetical protein ACXVKA_12490 [Acidimicrobiia bacterium]